MEELNRSFNKSLDDLLDFYTQENLRGVKPGASEDTTISIQNFSLNDAYKEQEDLTRYKILMDTCSFLEKSGKPAEIFLSRIEKDLQKAANKILVPQSVIDELLKQERNMQRPELNKPACRILKLIGFNGIFKLIRRSDC